MTGGAEVWSIDLAKATGALLGLEAEMGLLTPRDRETAGRMSDPAAGQQKLAASIGLRLLLSRVVGDLAKADLILGPHGKPGLPETGCHFNLSHSGSRCLIALSSREIGVDLETPRSVRMDAGRRAVIEHASIAVADGAGFPAVEGERRFLQAWTRLEALAKADGIGIGWLVTEIGVVGGKRRPQGAALPEPVLRLASRFETRDLDVGPFATAAVAVSRGMALNNTVRVREMPVELEALRALLSGRVAFF